MTKVNVLFCCMGNICRSPTAQGVFEHQVCAAQLAHLVAADSAGTHAYHVGEPPDGRSQACALRRGIDLGGQRARRVSVSDFEKFDYVLAMDRQNYDDLAVICPVTHKDRLRMFLSFAPDLRVSDVPDPYYGGPNGFDQVFDLVEEAARGLLAHIVTTHLTNRVK